MYEMLVMNVLNVATAKPVEMLVSGLMLRMMSVGTMSGIPPIPVIPAMIPTVSPRVMSSSFPWIASVLMLIVSISVRMIGRRRRIARIIAMLPMIRLNASALINEFM